MEGESKDNAEKLRKGLEQVCEHLMLISGIASGGQDGYKYASCYKALWEMFIQQNKLYTTESLVQYNTLCMYIRTSYMDVRV